MALADVVHEEQEPCAVVYHHHTTDKKGDDVSSDHSPSSHAFLQERLDELSQRAIGALEQQGFDK